MGNAQSRREEREARRKKTIRTWVAVSGAGIVALSGALLAFNLGVTDNADNPQAIPASCTTTQRVTVETDETMAEVLRQIPVSSKDCIVLAVDTNTSPLDTARHILQNTDVPNIWIPDSSRRAELALSGKAQVVTKTKTLAKTPAIVVTNAETQYTSWNDALKDATKLEISDPKEDSGSFMALLNAASESSSGKATSEQLTANVGQRAQTVGVDQPISSANELLGKVNSKNIDSTIVTEADYHNFLAENPDSAIKAYVPSNASGQLDYPLYIPSGKSDPNSTVTNAAEMIKNFMDSDEGKKALEEHGLRNAHDDELPVASVGPVNDLAAKDVDAIASMWTSYTRQSAPLNALIAIDVSGSMGESLGSTNRTRMDVTKEAVLAGSQLFPPRDSIGLWSFALNIGKDQDGKDTDYRELVPARNLAEKVDDTTQKEVLRTAVEQLQPQSGTHTGLNDTILAAFESVKNDYEPGSANVAVIFTDGKNTDSTSISTEDLIKQISQKQDKDNPVFLLLIGVSEDANMDNLRNIAKNTGGEAYAANSAEDIQKIFQEALTVKPDEATAQSSDEATTVPSN